MPVAGEEDATDPVPDSAPPNTIDPQQADTEYGDNLLEIDENDDAEEGDSLLAKPSTKSEHRHRTWKILFITLLSTILLTGVILAILGVSVTKPISSKTFPPTAPRPPKQPQVPKLPRPVNFALNFPQQYPALNAPENSECQRAWGTLTSIPCHEKIWNRGWDNGTHLSFMEPKPTRYVPQLCQPRCMAALKDAQMLISRSCGEDVTFNLDNYDGMFNTTLLERGPVAALLLLKNRNQHTCRKENEQGGYCMVEMYERWYILDGVYAYSFEGIDSFEQSTNKRGRQVAHWEQGSRGSTADGGWMERYKYWVPERTTGPGVNDTTCGWCTLTWFERKLSSWMEGQTIDPETGSPISLPDYIRRIRRIGRRCESSGWNRMYNSAVDSYINSGLLSPDWDRQPSGNLSYLIRHGASAGDEPIPSIERTMASIIHQNESLNELACLANLSNYIQSLPCYIHVSDAEAFNSIIPSANLLDAYCSEKCTTALRGSAPLQTACDNLPRYNPSWQILPGFYEAVLRRVNVCRQPRTRTYGTAPCSVVFRALNHPSWIFDGRPLTKAYFAALTPLLETIEQAPAPANLSQWLANPTPSALGKEEYHAYVAWKDELKNTVCGPCVWEWLASSWESRWQLGNWVTDAESPASYVNFVEKAKGICEARGVDWMNGLDHVKEEANRLEKWRIGN